MTLLINTSENYADEFNYPVISFFSSSIKNYLMLKGFHYLDNHSNITIGFGTNESLLFSIDQVKRMISNADTLDAEEEHYANRYLKQVPAVDIIAHILDKLYEVIEEDDPDELPNYDAILEEHG